MTKTVVFALSRAEWGTPFSPGAFPMRSKKGFVHASRELLDGWISSTDETSPEQLYEPALPLLTANMVLCIHRNASPLIVRGYSVQVGQDVTVDEIACRWLASRHHEGQAHARPISARELIEAEGNHVALDALLLPQRGGGWSLAAIDIQVVLPISNLSSDLNAVDHAILQLLYQGFSAKEIAQQIGLSHRTVEHRVERLKANFGARTIAQLVALSIANGLNGKGLRASTRR